MTVSSGSGSGATPSTTGCSAERRPPKATSTALDEQARTRFRRRHIGFVFQLFNLIPLLTVEENLLLPLDLNGRADAEGVARVRALLERVGSPAAVTASLSGCRAASSSASPSRARDPRT